METKEELLKEYFKVYGYAGPIAKKEHEQNPEIFEWIWNKINDAQTNEALRREEVKVLMRQVLNGDAKISRLEATLKIADEIIDLSSPADGLLDYEKDLMLREKYNQLKKQSAFP